MRRQIRGYRKPTMDLFALAAALERSGCPNTAEELRLQRHSHVGGGAFGDSGMAQDRSRAAALVAVDDHEAVGPP